MANYVLSFCAVCESEHSRDSLYCSRRCQKVEIDAAASAAAASSTNRSNNGTASATPTSSHSLNMPHGNSSSSSLSYFPPQPQQPVIAGSPRRQSQTTGQQSPLLGATAVQRKSFDRNRPLPPKRASLSSSLPKSSGLVMPLTMTPMRSESQLSLCNGQNGSGFFTNGHESPSPVAMRRSQSSSSTHGGAVSAASHSNSDLPPLSSLKYPLKPAGSRFDYNGSSSPSRPAPPSSATTTGRSRSAAASIADGDVNSSDTETGSGYGTGTDDSANPQQQQGPGQDRPLRKMFFFKRIQADPAPS